MRYFELIFFTFKTNPSSFIVVFQLSSDRDLFLEDDAGSGDGRPPGFGDIDNGSGCSIDDEDFEDCKAKNAKTPPPVHQKPRYGDDVDPIPNSNEPPNFGGKSVFDEKHEANFFSQPGILAGTPHLISSACL